MAAKRAFVIGNGAYSHAGVLPNPTNDAQDLARKLQESGYDVTITLNADRTRFLSEFQTFVRGLKGDDLALLFYAGHGVQIGGENYLFPIDAAIQNETDVKSQLIPLNALLADLARATDNRIVILDACRNNPFLRNIERSLKVRSQSMSVGLARVYSGVGSFIAFSTQPGNVAADGSGRNSPFTTALLKHVSAGNLDVHGAMRRVRADVQRQTNGLQIPWENSSLTQDISFAQGVKTVGPVGVQPSDGQVSGKRANMVRYHYVGGLDPKGDNFLALKDGPSVRSRRLGTMGPNTLLQVTGSKGKWKRVVLVDGTTGWAHGNWIKCCLTLNQKVVQATAGGETTDGPDTCESLWQRRNAIWHRHHYCFRTKRAQRVFDISGCYRNQAQARKAMSPSERALIADLKRQENALGCR